VVKVPLEICKRPNLSLVLRLLVKQAAKSDSLVWSAKCFVLSPRDEVGSLKSHFHINPDRVPGAKAEAAARPCQRDGEGISWAIGNHCSSTREKYFYEKTIQGSRQFALKNSQTRSAPSNDWIGLLPCRRGGVPGQPWPPRSSTTEIVTAPSGVAR